MTHREQRCARHPDRDGAVACTRCGSFACPECERAGLRGALCVACHGKLSDLARRARRARRSGSTFALVAVLSLLSAGSLLLNLERGGAVLVVVAAGLAAFAGVGFKTALVSSALRVERCAR